MVIDDKNHDARSTTQKKNTIETDMKKNLVINERKNATNNDDDDDDDGGDDDHDNTIPITSSKNKKKEQQDLRTKQHSTKVTTKKIKEKNQSTNSKRHGARNQNRHKKMIKWLLHTFPQEIQDAKDTVETPETAVVDAANSRRNEAKPEDASHKKRTNATSGIPSASSQHPQSRQQQQQQQQQQHILDVAGGKGELSARMTLCCTLHVRMVDPRRANIYDCFYKTVFRSLPKKWQQKINSHLEEEEHHEQDDEHNRNKQDHNHDHNHNPTSTCSSVTTQNSKIQAMIHRRFFQYVQQFPMDGIGDATIQQLEQDDNQELFQAVQQASLIIGLHADGATEAIVDIALYYNKPFVVVPCCVFPNFFRHRLVPAIMSSINDDDTDPDAETDAETDTDIDTNAETTAKNNTTKTKTNIATKMVPVRNHEQFCRYLALKDSHFVVETLPFEGRNIAIWWDGKCKDGDE